MGDGESSNNQGALTIRCPGCQQKLAVPPSRFGKPFRCSKCGKNLLLKAPGGEGAAKKGLKEPIGEGAQVPSIPPVPPQPSPSVIPPSGQFATPAESNNLQPFEFLPDGPLDPILVSTSKPKVGIADGKGKFQAKTHVAHWIFAVCLAVLTGGMVGGAIYSWRLVLDKEREIQEARANVVQVEKDTTGGKEKDRAGKGASGNSAGSIAFPRRALLIAINEYLYANPVQKGYANSWKGLDKLGRSLQLGMRFPGSQVANFSDAVPGGPLPLKANLEKTLADFLQSSRKQDQVIVWFTGHGVLLGEKAYLAPLDGDLEQAGTLVPLDWVFEKFKGCPARQKILVLDVYRFNPVIGHERPGSDPMPDGFEKQALQPPPGVEVVLACGKGQNSYETEEEPMGVLPFALSEVLNSLHTGEMTPDDPIPVVSLVEKVNQGVTKDVRMPIRPLAERLESTKRDGKAVEMKVLAAGGPPADGGKFDPAEAAPPIPVLARGGVESQTGRDLNAQVLKELALPPIKRGRGQTDLHVETLPVLPVEAAASFKMDSKEETPLQKAMKKAQVNMWAISGMDPPGDLKDLVLQVRREKKVNLETMVDFYGKPADEARFKTNVENNQKDIAKVFAIVEGDYETLKELGEDVSKEPKRIQAHFLFLKARLEAQIAYLYEYQSALGSIRKELPPLEKGHSGWRLASSPKLRGDRAGKQMDKDQKADLKKLIEKYPGSPWAILARRDMLTTLGLEWQSAAKRE